MSRLPRFLPPLIIGVLVVGLVAFTWIGASDSSEQIRQSKVLQTAGILGVGALLLLLWVGLFSPLPRRTRATVVVGFFVVVASFLALFRFRGVSGDLVPQFEPRFRASSTDLPDVDWASLPGARSRARLSRVGIGHRRRDHGVHCSNGFVSTAGLG